MTALLDHNNPVSVALAAMPAAIAPIFCARTTEATVIVAGHAATIPDAEANILRAGKGGHGYRSCDDGSKCVS